MLHIIRKCKGFIPLAVVLAGNLIFSTAAFGASISRIMPTDRVRAYQGERLVHTFNREAPFPEDLMLKTEGRCGVRMDDFYLVADDQTLFGIRHHNNERILRIEQGMVYFALSSLPGKLVFETPDGVFPTQQILVQAAAGQGTMKAYVEVRRDRTEIGVLEGGQMVVSTPDGEQRIASGRQITLAQALIFDEEGGGAAEEQPEEGVESEEPAEQAERSEQTPEPTAKKPRTGVYVGVGLAAVAIIGGALALGGGGGGGGSGGGGDDGDDPSVSPID